MEYTKIYTLVIIKMLNNKHYNHFNLFTDPKTRQVIQRRYKSSMVRKKNFFINLYLTSRYLIKNLIPCK